MGRFSGTHGVGVLWYRRDEYPRMLRLMTDARELPRSFNEWQKRANEALAFIKSEGGKAVRVEANLDKIVAYCTIRGLGLDAQGRSMFAADPANWPASSKN